MRGGRRGHFKKHLLIQDSLVAGFSNLRHVEMGKRVGQDCHMLVKCIICFLAFNNFVTWNFTIFFNSRVVDEATTPQFKREESTINTTVTPNLNSGPSFRFPSSETSLVNRSNPCTFFTSYMVTTLLLPTVLIFSLNATFGHRQTTAPRLFASRALAILLCVVQLLLLKVKEGFIRSNIQRTGGHLCVTF